MSLNGLWNYWNEPKPKARLGKVEKEDVVTTDDFLFCIKFVLLVITIIFTLTIIRGLIL